INANRRNAMKATGPRTEAGKNISKYNGVTHGLCADGAVPGEDRGALEAMIERWCRDLGASTEVERALATNAAKAQWGLDRAYRVGEAATGGRAAPLPRRHDEGDAEEVARLADELAVNPQGALRQLRASALGVLHLLSEFESLAEQLREFTTLQPSGRVRG